RLVPDLSGADVPSEALADLLREPLREMDLQAAAEAHANARQVRRAERASLARRVEQERERVSPHRRLEEAVVPAHAPLPALDEEGPDPPHDRVVRLPARPLLDVIPLQDRHGEQADLPAVGEALADRREDRVEGRELRLLPRSGGPGRVRV